MMIDNKGGKHGEPEIGGTTAWCSRLRTEMSCSYPMFSIDELGGAVLDISGTFAPSGMSLRLARLIIFAFIVGGGMIVSILDFNPVDGKRAIWLGFLTHWTLLVTIAYFFCVSFLHYSAFLSKKKGGDSYVFQPDGADRTAGKLVRLTWALYATGMPANIVVVLLFWTLDYKPGDEIKFKTVMVHAVTCVLMLVDGNLISRIPLRAKQVVLPMAYSATYLIWTVINSLAGIGDGTWEGEDEDQTNEDDQLYNVLDWKHNPQKAAIIAVPVLLIVVPLCFFVCWILSVWSGRCSLDGSRRRTLLSSEPGSESGPPGVDSSTIDKERPEVSVY